MAERTDRERFRAASRAQQTADVESRFRAGALVPEPYRITLALDARGLEGPEVDTACLAQEPAVDQWEAGDAVPTWEQLNALADLTQFPLGFFFMKAEPHPGPAIICGADGCVSVTPDPPVQRWSPLARVIPLRARQTRASSAVTRPDRKGSSRAVEGGS